MKAKERERSWQKQQTQAPGSALNIASSCKTMDSKTSLHRALCVPTCQGELDEMRLVDGIAGARNIYRSRFLTANIRDMWSSSASHDSLLAKFPKVLMRKKLDSVATAK